MPVVQPRLAQDQGVVSEPNCGHSTEVPWLLGVPLKACSTAYSGVFLTFPFLVMTGAPLAFDVGLSVEGVGAGGATVGGLTLIFRLLTEAETGCAGLLGRRGPRSLMRLVGDEAASLSLSAARFLGAGLVSVEALRLAENDVT